MNKNENAAMGDASPVHAVIGELTIAVAAENKASVAAWVSDGKSATLDLSGVSRVDCAGLQLIIAAERTGRVALTALSLPMRHAMETIGFMPADAAREG